MALQVPSQFKHYEPLIHPSIFDIRRSHFGFYCVSTTCNVKPLATKYVIRHCRDFHSLPKSQQTNQWCPRFGNLLKYIPELSENDSLISPPLDGWACSVPGCDFVVPNQNCHWIRHIKQKDHVDLTEPPTLQACKYRKSICGRLIPQASDTTVSSHESVDSLNPYVRSDISSQQIWLPWDDLEVVVSPFVHRTESPRTWAAHFRGLISVGNSSDFEKQILSLIRLWDRKVEHATEPVLTKILAHAIVWLTDFAAIQIKSVPPNFRNRLIDFDAMDQDGNTKAGSFILRTTSEKLLTEFKKILAFAWRHPDSTLISIKEEFERNCLPHQ